MVTVLRQKLPNKDPQELNELCQFLYMRAYGKRYKDNEYETLPIPVTEALWTEIAKDQEFYRYLTEGVIGKYVPFVAPNKSEKEASKEIRRHQGLISMLEIFAPEHPKKPKVSQREQEQQRLDAYVEDPSESIAIVIEVDKIKNVFNVQRSDTVLQVIRQVVREQGLIQPKKHFLYFPYESKKPLREYDTLQESQINAFATLRFE